MANPQELKDIGLKVTTPRLRILDLFRKLQDTPHNRHMSAEDVYRLLIAEGIDIGLATVYRALTQFEQAGLLERRNFESGKAVFELKEESHHDHLVCTTCGRVEEFHDAEIERRQEKIAKERGFTIKGHELSIYAECIRKNCPNRAQREKEAVAKSQSS